MKQILTNLGKLAAIGVMFFTTPLLVKGQLIGWPSSGGAEVDYMTLQTISSGTTYMDNNRARVTAISAPSGTPAQYTLTLSNQSGSFTAGKWCAIIQMAGAIATNNNCMVKVVSYSSPTLVVEVLAGNTWPSLTLTGTYDRVQIVQIPIYWELTLNGGEITCSPYDFATGTGGVLPLIIGNNITINGGYFSVSGKGYINDWSGSPTLGTGGAGATATATPTVNFLGGAGGYPGELLSNQPTWGNICPNAILPRPINVTPLTIGNTGFAGDGENCSGRGAGVATANIEYYYPSSPSVSNPKTIFRMGDAGTAGASGGIGACAGGWGGVGGNSVNYSGTAGLTGTNGGNGGGAAQGGSGGGMMYLKFATTTINPLISNISSYKLFYADGGQGGNGGQGGDGGDGGRGGMGGDGDCGTPAPNLNTPGGWGGFGESGTGAGGGNAGKGGKPGTIWIVKGGSTPSLGRYMRVGGGIGGGGGRGGYSKRYIGNFSARNYTPSSFQMLPCIANDWTFCTPPPPPCARVVCDCDKIFKHWGENGAPGVTFSGSSPNYNINFTNGATSISYNNGASKYLSLVEIVSGCTVTYQCYMIKQAQFQKMMLKAMGITYPLQTYIPAVGCATSSTLFATNNADYNISTLKTSLIYTDPCAANKTVFIYDPATKRLTDEDDVIKPYAEAVNCGQTSGGGSGGGGGVSSGEPGEFEQFVETYYEKTGDDAPDEPDQPDGNDPDNMSEESSGAYVFPTYENGMGINNKPSPMISPNIKNSTLVLTVLKDVNTESICNIYSMEGKLISTQKVINKEVKFENIAAGIYIVEIQSQGKSFVERIIVDR